MGRGNRARLIYNDGGTHTATQLSTHLYQVPPLPCLVSIYLPRSTKNVRAGAVSRYLRVTAVLRLRSTLYRGSFHCIRFLL